MEAAVSLLGAEKGIFVPVGRAYLKRKTRKIRKNAANAQEAAETWFMFDEKTRLEALEALCRADSRFVVDDFDMRFPDGRTYETMLGLQEQYPDAELYFVAGADKWDLFRAWAERTDFLTRFRVALFGRGDDDPQTKLSQDETL